LAYAQCSARSFGSFVVCKVFKILAVSEQLLYGEISK